MAISKDTVVHIAKLSGLSLSDVELTKMQGELSDILEHVESLAEVPTDGVPPTSHVHGVVNAFREDITKPSLPIEEVLKMAPDSAHGGFRVPKII
jgi:aspartyl-tRNA(Asn)/glutamyl-tRNA(Gln) amidotransferase subunit C